MTDLQLTVRIHGDSNERDLEFQATDVAVALVIADINADLGRADIRCGDQVLARLTRRNGDHAPFWQVG